MIDIAPSTVAGPEHDETGVARPTTSSDVSGGRRSPTIGVIICCYTDRRWSRLVAAIEGVLGQTSPAEQLVVAVDHHDELRRRLMHEFPGAVVVANEGPRGVSGARNTGVAACTADVVVFLDDDATPAPDWLSTIRDAFEDPEVVAVGGHVEPDWEVARPRWFPHEFDWVVGCSHHGLPADGERIRNPIGANMAVRREALVEVGGFDTTAGRVGADTSGCDETELFIHLAAHRPGATVRISRRAVVAHHVPVERASARYFARRCWSEGRSKALMTSRTGTEAGLSEERAYVRSVLPRGVTRGVVDAARGDVAGLGRATAIVGGLATTVAGYLAGRIGSGGGR